MAEYQLKTGQVTLPDAYGDPITINVGFKPVYIAIYGQTKTTISGTAYLQSFTMVYANGEGFFIGDNDDQYGHTGLASDIITVTNTGFKFDPDKLKYNITKYLDTYACTYLAFGEE